MSLLTNIAAYYKFDENTGTTVNDATGKGFTGTYTGTGTTWQTGLINSAGQFNASDSDVVSVPNFSNQLVGLTAFSMNCWAKPTNISSNDFGGIAGLRDNDTDDGFYILQLNNGSNIEYRFRNGTGTAFSFDSSSNILSTTAWTMLTMVYDGSNLVCYANGSVVNTQSGVSGTFLNNSEGFYMGRGGNSDTYRYFVGGIDEVGFWLRALTAPEITQLYNSGAGLQYPFGPLDQAMTFSGFSFTSKLNISGVGI